MATRQINSVLQHIRRLADGRDASTWTDHELLDRFINKKEGDAFSGLIQRHGPMVMALGWRILRDRGDAEDVFQATFMILAQKACSIRKRESIGGWLYRVAFRLALRSRAEAKKRRRLVPSKPEAKPADPLDEVSWREVCTALDEELARLPDHCRAPLVLCYLEGKTQDEAMHQLGWSKNTFRRRLEEGRTKLSRRLTRRGITLSAGLWATLLADPLQALTQPGSSFLSSALAQSTMHAAIPLAAGETVAGAISPQVTLLIKEALHGTVIHKMKWIALIGIASALTTGLGLAAHHALTTRPTGDQRKELLTFADEQRSQPNLEKPKPPRLDLYGDPLPEGAIARLGTVRWRTDAHGVDAMAVTADGKSLLTANTETGITIWDMSNGKVVRRIPQKREDHKEWFGQRTGWLHVALSADGRRGVFMPEGAVYVVDITTGKEIQHWENPIVMNRAVISGDGKTLVTRSDQGRLLVWSTDSAKLLRELPGTPKQESLQTRWHWLALSADGKTVAWVGEDKSCPIHVLDVQSGEERHQLGGHDKGGRQIAMSPNGQWLVSASGDGLVQLWDLRSGRLARKWSGRERGSFYSLPIAAFSPDSQRLVVTRPGEIMQMLEVASGKELWHVSREMTATQQDSYAFTPDGKTLLVHGAALGNAIHRYKTSTGERLLSAGELTDTIREAAFHPDERSVFTLGRDGNVLKSWDMGTGKEKSKTLLDIYWGQFSPDGQLIAGIKDDSLRVFETSTGRERWRFNSTPRSHPQSWGFSPDGKLIVGCGEQTEGEKRYSVIFWDMTTGKESRRISVKDPVWHIAFYGRSVVAQPWPVGSNKPSPMLQSWDIFSGQEQASFSLPSNDVMQTLSPEGKTVILMGENPLKGFRSLEFVETGTGQVRMEIDMSQICRTYSLPLTATYSPNGNLFLFSDAEGQMQVLDAFTGKRVRTVSGERGSFSFYAFSRSGKCLATLSSPDATGLIWDTTKILGDLPASTDQLTPDELVALWDDLASKDATKAYQAIGRLILSPRQATAWLREHLKPASTGSIEKNRLEHLLVKLDSDDFAVREEATKEIEKLGADALPALEKTLQAKPSAEVRKRVEALLEKIGPARFRPLRTVETLEHIGSSEAREVLKILATGEPEARLTQEARESLERLSKRITGSL